MEERKKKKKRQQQSTDSQGCSFWERGLWRHKLNKHNFWRVKRGSAGWRRWFMGTFLHVVSHLSVKIL